MSDPSFGTWLARERERRGVSLKAISDQTKVSLPFLEGLEADDLSRWPAGIFRRAFVRSYASAVGLDLDEVISRFEAAHGEVIAQIPAGSGLPGGAAPVAGGIDASAGVSGSSGAPARTRLLGTAADLMVALVFGLGSAAVGSRLLWPVLLIACYYAIGVLLTGTSPMVALLSDQMASAEPPPVLDPHRSAERDGGHGRALQAARPSGKLSHTVPNVDPALR